MKVIKVIVDELPEVCGDCDFQEDWVGADGDTDAYYLTCKWDEKRTKIDIHNAKFIRLRSCPLVSKGQIQKLIVTPSYDNAWDMVSFVLGIAGESESE